MGKQGFRGYDQTNLTEACDKAVFFFNYWSTNCILPANQFFALTDLRGYGSGHDDDDYLGSTDQKLKPFRNLDM